MRRHLTAALVATTLLTGVAAPAAAGPAGDLGSDEPAPDLSVDGRDDATAPVPGGPVMPGSSATHCVTPSGHRGPIGHHEPPEPQEHYWENREQYFASATGSGAWYWRTCGGAGDRIVFVPGAGPGYTLVDVEAVVDLWLPEPVVHTSPAPDRYQLVHLPTWLWAGDGTWEEITVSEVRELGGARVRIDVVATPMARVEWDMGDGSGLVTCAQGRPYDPTRPDAEQEPSCSHVYTASSAGQPGGAYTVTAAAWWDVLATVNGTVEIDGPLAKRSTAELRVAERQVLNRPEVP